MGKSKFGFRPALLMGVTAFSAGMGLVASPPAYAQETTRPYQIAPQDLDDALREFARQTGRDVLFTPASVARKQSPGARGQLTERQALAALLNGSGLHVEQTASDGYAVQDPNSPTQLGAANDTAPSEAGSGEEVTSGRVNDQVEDVVVFGRKRARAEDLQRTPLSVTALGAEQLQSPTIRDLTDVGRLTANASLQPAGQRGVQNFIIRGMGVSGTNPSDEPAVGILQDGVYWGANYGALGELLDLEGIEVFRGPQGTLFGRNVTAGAVSIRSARPGHTPYHRATANIANGDSYGATIVLNEPLGDTVAVRLAALGRTSEGLFTNINDGGSFGGADVTLLRPSIRWTPTDDLDVTLLGEYYQLDGDPIAIRGVSPVTLPPGTSPAQAAGYLTSNDYTDLQFGDRGFSRLEVHFAMVEVNLRLGPGTLTSITGYRSVQSRNQVDFDGFPVNGFLQTAANEQEQFSEELRYAADLTDWLSVTGGIYYFDQNFQYSEMRDALDHAVLTAARAELDNSSYAAFLEADIRPSENLTVTLGGRYTHEEKEPRAAPFGSCPFNFVGPCTFQTREAYTDNNISPKIGFSYQIDPTMMLFASFTSGYRSGGYSLRGTPLGAPYEAETVDAYEVGFKSDLFDRRVRLNLTAYSNSFENLQRTVVAVDPLLGTVQSVFNAANATIEGAEIELIVIPTAGLRLSGNYGFADANYDSFLGSSTPETLKFVRVPRHIANVAIDYDMPLANGDSAALHLGASYTGKNYFDERGLMAQSGYWLFDASASYELNDNITLTAYARNLTDEEYGFWGTLPGGPAGQNILVGEPRSYGVRLEVDF